MSRSFWFYFVHPKPVKIKLNLECRSIADCGPIGNVCVVRSCGVIGCCRGVLRLSIYNSAKAAVVMGGTCGSSVFENECM